MELYRSDITSKELSVKHIFSWQPLAVTPVDPPWCSCWGRVIKFRPLLLTVGLLYCHFCSWVPIGQAETLTEQRCTLMLFLMDILSLSPFKGLWPEYWSTDIPPHTQLLLFFLPFTLHRHFSNKSLKYLLSLHLFLTGPNDTSIYWTAQWVPLSASVPRRPLLLL